MDRHEKWPPWVPLIFGITEVIGVLILVLVAVWIVFYNGGFSSCNDPRLLFNWHPMLLTVSMIFLNANALLVFRPFPRQPQGRLVLVHAVVQIIALLCAIIGLRAVFTTFASRSPPAPNLYSLHSWIGLATVILFSCQCLCGLIVYLCTDLKPRDRTLYKPFHYYFGLLIFVCCVATAMMGLLEDAHWSISGYEEHPFEGSLVNFTGLLLAIFTGLVVFIVTKPELEHRPLPEERPLKSSQSDDTSIEE